jgi:hypothetical protein
MLMDPYNAQTVKGPMKDNAYTGATRRFFRSYDITSTGPGQFYSYAFPDWQDSFIVGPAVASTNTPWDVAISPDDAFVFTNNSCPISNKSYEDAGLHYDYLQGIAQNRTAMVHSIVDLDGDPIFPIACDSGPIALGFNASTMTSATYSVSLRTTALGAAPAWVKFVPGLSNGAPYNGWWNFASANRFYAIKIAVKRSLKTYSISLTANVPATVVGAHSMDLLRPATIEMSKVTTYRVAAMSILVTSLSPAINDGGAIAAARINDMLKQDPKYDYDKLTTLEGAYNGELKQGAYVFWLPKDLEEMSPKEIRGVDATSTGLAVCGKFTQAGQQIRILYTIVVDFTSVSQTIEKLPFPAWTDNFDIFLQALASQQCAFSNSSHLKALKAIASALGRGAQRAGKWALGNPQQVARLASMAGLV